MPFPQRSNGESLRCLRCPECSTIRRVGNQPQPIHALDRVGHRRRSDHRIASQHCSSAAIEQSWIDQTAGTVMNQHMLRICRESNQTALDRFLAGAATLDPGDRLGRSLQQGRNLAVIPRLADDPDPADLLSGESRLQGPGQQWPPPKMEQEFVAISSHTPAAARCGDQQMHKRLLLPAG